MPHQAQLWLERAHKCTGLEWALEPVPNVAINVICNSGKITSPLSASIASPWRIKGCFLLTIFLPLLTQLCFHAVSLGSESGDSREAGQAHHQWPGCTPAYWGLIHEIHTVWPSLSCWGDAEHLDTGRERRQCSHRGAPDSVLRSNMETLKSS